MSSDAELDALVAIAIRGAERVRELYQAHCRADIAVEMKGPGDPVTAADRQANDIIVAALREQFGEAAIIAEESEPGAADRLTMRMGGRVFFVDPLDGTREFVDKNGEFATMIGLSEDGAAVAGAVCLPIEMRVLAGRVGAGAFVQERDGSRTPLEVSACERFDQARMLVSRSHRPALIAPLCSRLGISHTLPCGSVGLKVARLLLGEADLYVHDGPGMKLWDTCGPEAILHAAGGRLSDLSGHAIDYGGEGLALDRGVVASNARLHPGVLSAVTYARRMVSN